MYDGGTRRRCVTGCGKSMVTIETAGRVKVKALSSTGQMEHSAVELAEPRQE